MVEEVYKVALAGLLHDIGKFAQRAGEGHSISWNDDSKAEFKYEHALYADDVLPRLVPEQWRAEVRGPAGRHHRPQTHLERVVALADRLSAGERSDSVEIQPKRLLSIFCRVSVGGKTIPKEQYRYWPLKALELSEDALFPTYRDESDGADAAYKVLWDGFVREAETLRRAHEGQKADLATYLEEMLALMQRYTWCIPAAYYRAVPDVSLYDHSRMTAAMAVCLGGLGDEVVQKLLNDPDDDTAIALLVKGDISGIQDFIYTITARGATRGLKGRSFYIQLLTEAVAGYILRRLGLPPTNLIYSGGGHFYLLLRAEDEEGLPTLQAELSWALLRHHRGDLYLAMGGERLAGADFALGRFADRWKGVGMEVARVKRQRFAELTPDEMYEGIFTPQGHGGNEERECAVCHYEGSDVCKREAGTGEEAVRKCDLCVSLEELGRDLRCSDYLVLGQVEPVEARGRSDWRAALREFGLEVRLLDEKGKAVDKADFRAERAKVLAMRDLDGTPAVREKIARLLGCPAAFGLRYFVNLTPRVSRKDTEDFRKDHPEGPFPNEGDVKEFGLLQEQSQGIERLGVLRLDADDIGYLFSEGFKTKDGANIATLSRLGGLSSALSLFFEGWVGKLCRQVMAEDRWERGTDLIYTLYSGGDDLFIVGVWDLIPELAGRIRHALGKYAADNPALHASAGISLHGGKYPLYQAAQEAHEALEAAKAFRRPGGERKDALSFLGVTMGWKEDELFWQVEEQMKGLVELVLPADNDKGVPRSLLQTLLNLYDQYRQAREKRQRRIGKGRNLADEEQVYWGPWMWRGAYFLRRQAEQQKRKGEEVVAAAIEGIADSLKGENFRHIEVIGPAARWADLLVRSRETG